MGGVGRGSIAQIHNVSSNTGICRQSILIHIQVCRLVSEGPGSIRIRLICRIRYLMEGRIRILIKETQIKFSSLISMKMILRIMKISINKIIILLKIIFKIKIIKIKINKCNKRWIKLMIYKINHKMRIKM